MQQVQALLFVFVRSRFFPRSEFLRIALMLSREHQEERMAGKDHLVIYFNKPGKKQRKQ